MVWPNSATKVPEIRGLQTTGLSSATFRILDPGRLTISFPASSVIAEIAGTRAGFISSDWSSKVQWMMAPKRAWPRGTPRNLFSFLTVEFTEQILSRIRQLGHGGTVVFVPDDLLWSKSVDRPIFYDCSQRLNELEPIVEALRHEVSAISSKDPREIMKSGITLIASAPYERAIGDAADSVAYLSSVDGATILNNEFSVLAFGVKLKPTKKKKASTTEMIAIISPYEGIPLSDVPIDQEFRGTRHLSAARFVLNNPNAVAFVVSQDGGITGLIMDQDSPGRLLAIKSLELLL